MADWSASAKQRIRRGIRAVESGRFESASDQLDRPEVPLQFFRARSKETYLAGTIGTFRLILSEGDKGDEEESTEEVDAYVREGLTLEGADYILAELSIADDAILEVLDFEQHIRGTMDGATLKGFAGTMSLFRRAAGVYVDTGKNLSVFNELQDRSTTDIVYCEWERDIGGSDSRWKIYAWEC